MAALLARGHDDQAHLADLAAKEELQRVLEQRQLYWQEEAAAGEAEGNCRPPLHCACIWGCLQAARLLIDSGADMDACDSQGYTPLMWSCAMGHEQVVQLLLSRGADPSIQHESGISALGHACRDGNPRIIRALLRDGRCRMDETNPYGARVLYWPCYYGHLEAARVLLMEGGADPYHRDDMGRTAADVARQKGHHALVELLEGFEKELERAVLLIKARRLEDDCAAMKYCKQGCRPVPRNTTLPRCAASKATSKRQQQHGSQGETRQSAETPWVPAYLEERVNNRDALPVVELPGEGVREGGTTCRRKVVGGDEEREDDLCAVVLRHVVRVLKDDPFVELMAMMRYR